MSERINCGEEYANDSRRSCISVCASARPDCGLNMNDAVIAWRKRLPGKYRPSWKDGYATRPKNSKKTCAEMSRWRSPDDATNCDCISIGICPRPSLTAWQSARKDCAKSTTSPSRRRSTTSPAKSPMKSRPNSTVAWAKSSPPIRCRARPRFKIACRDSDTTKKTSCGLG